MRTTGAAAARLIGSASAPSICDQLVMNDLDDHLAGGDRLDDLGADRLLPHPLGEIAHDFERDIGLDQGAADFAQRCADILFRQRAAPRQAVEDAAEPFRERLKQDEAFLAGRIRGPNAVAIRGRTALPDVGRRDLFIPFRVPAGGRNRRSDEIWKRIDAVPPAKSRISGRRAAAPHSNQGSTRLTSTPRKLAGILAIRRFAVGRRNANHNRTCNWPRKLSAST